MGDGVPRDNVDSLASDSIKSLALQDGPMSDIEILAFLCELYAQDAIRLRRYDDLAKDPSAHPADLAHFLRHLR